MRALWSIICQGSSVDIDSNNLSIFNIWEEVSLEAIEVRRNQSERVRDTARTATSIIPLPFTIVTLLLRDDEGQPEKAKVRLRVTLPDDQTIVLGNEQEVDLSRHTRLRLRRSVPGIPIGGTGEYQFVTEILEEGGKWKEGFVTPLKVQISLHHSEQENALDSIKK